MGAPGFERVSAEDDSSNSLLPHDSDISPESPNAYYRPRGFRLSITTTCLMVYCACAVTAMVVFAATILGQLQALAKSKGCERNYEFRAAFGYNQALMSVDHKFDSLWDSQEVRENVIDLPDENAGGEPLPATISMFHQLHCLAALRHAIQMAREGHDPGVDHRDDDHWPHCMDYLRKTILCWADPTIERRRVFKDGVHKAIDGAQDMRKCGDSNSLFQIMRDHGKNVTTEAFPTDSKFKKISLDLLEQ